MGAIGCRVACVFLLKKWTKKMKHSKIYRPLCAITLGASLLVGCAVGNKERSISLTPSPHVLTLDADRKAVVDVSFHPTPSSASRLRLGFRIQS